MKKIILFLWILLNFTSIVLNAQVIGETDDISSPAAARFNITGIAARTNSVSCEDNCNTPYEQTYACGYTMGCSQGAQDGYDDASACDIYNGTPSIGGNLSDDFLFGYFDGYAFSYIQAYNEGIAEKTVECTDRRYPSLYHPIDIVEYVFDEYSCNCDCIKKQYLYDSDNDGYYDREIFYKEECEAPSPEWKLASDLLGPDCNDKDPEVWYYNQCGLCIANQSGITTWYYDADGDGYYGNTQTSCN